MFTILLSLLACGEEKVDDSAAPVVEEQEEIVEDTCGIQLLNDGTVLLVSGKKTFTFNLTNLVNMLYYIRDAKLPNNCTVVTNFTGEKVKKNKKNLDMMDISCYIIKE